MLAIVIPYYNYKYFEKTLDSLANQINKDFKVFIGDDASDDDPLLLLNEYKNKFDFEYKRFENNFGANSLVKQWKRCIKMTTNEPWIQILGDDDVLEKNSVLVFYENLEIIKRENVNVVRFASRYINENDEPLKDYEDFFHPNLELATNSFYRNFKGNSRSSLSEHIFSRKSYEKYGFYDFPIAYYSDDRAWLEFSNFKNLLTLNDSIISIRVSRESITGKSSNKLFKNKARYLFFKDIIYNKIQHFDKNQKIEFLLEFGILIKQQGKINIKNVLQIAFHLLRIGAFESLLKFIRRMYIAKLKNNS